MADPELAAESERSAQPPPDVSHDVDQEQPTSAESYVYEQMMSMMLAASTSQDQILDKLTPGHLNKIIDQNGEAFRLQHQLQMHEATTTGRGRTTLIVAGTVLALGLPWIYLSYGTSAELMQIVTLLFGLGGAGGVGYTIAGSRKNPSKTGGE